MKKRILLGALVFAFAILGLYKTEIKAASISGQIIGDGYCYYYGSDDGKNAWVTFATNTSCTITDLVIPKTINGLTVTQVSGCFLSESIKSIVFPETVTSLGGETIAGFCNNLTSVTLPNAITEIPSRAFLQCKSLTNINIPDNVKIIDESAFDQCESLKSIIIPNGVTKINNYAFSNCKSLTSINIPNSVTYLGYSAFCDCDNLKQLKIPYTVKYIGSEAFGFCYDEDANRIKTPGFTAYVHDDSAAYKYCVKNSLHKVVEAHVFKSFKTTKNAKSSSKGTITGTCTICGKKITKSIYIKLSKTKLSLKKKKSYTVKATYSKYDSIKSWKSNNKKVATVTSSGKITGKKKGTAIITVTLKSGLKASVKVTVK